MRLRPSADGFLKTVKSHQVSIHIFATFISQPTFSAQWPRRSFNSPTSYFSWSKSCKFQFTQTHHLVSRLFVQQTPGVWRSFNSMLGCKASNLRSKHHRGCQVYVWFPWFWSSPPLINPNTTQTGQLRMEKNAQSFKITFFSLACILYFHMHRNVCIYLNTMIKHHQTTFRTGAYNTGWFQFL